jgi:hypothetical protein
MDNEAIDFTDVYEVPKGNKLEETKVIGDRVYRIVHALIEGKATTKSAQPIPNRSNQE